MTSENIKFVINQNGYKAWGISSFRQKTMFKRYINGKIAKEDIEATEKDIKEGNSRYGNRYFAYIVSDGKPTLYVENRDKLKDGSWGPKYFKPATIKWNKTNERWTHNDRATDLPFLCCTIRIDDKVYSNSVRSGEILHINSNNMFKNEKITDSMKFTNSNRWTGKK